MNVWGNAPATVAVARAVRTTRKTTQITLCNTISVHVRYSVGGRAVGWERLGVTQR
jgi:hypothetical protein